MSPVVSLVHAFRSICYRNRVSSGETGRSVAYLLGEVHDDLGETTSKNAERGQDGTKRVDPHEVDLSLKSEWRGSAGIRAGEERRRRLCRLTIETAAKPKT